MSFSTSTVIFMSRLLGSYFLSFGCGESICGAWTRLVTPRTSSARTSTGVSGSIREVLGIGVDTALIGPALSEIEVRGWPPFFLIFLFVSIEI